jgi:hypothetical protein
MTSPALAAEQRCLDHQLGQHQPLAQILEFQQAGTGAPAQFGLISGHQSMGQA